MTKFEAKNLLLKSALLPFGTRTYSELRHAADKYMDMSPNSENPDPNMNVLSKTLAESVVKAELHLLHIAIVRGISSEPNGEKLFRFVTDNYHKFEQLKLPGKNRVVRVCNRCGLRIRIFPGSRKKPRQFNKCPIEIVQEIHES